MLVCAFSLCNLHPRPRVQRAPGIPCSLLFSRDNVDAKLGQSVSREHGSLSVSGEALIKLNPAPPCHCEEHSCPPKLYERRRKQSILPFARPLGLLRTPVAHS